MESVRDLSLIIGFLLIVFRPIVQFVRTDEGCGEVKIGFINFGKPGVQFIRLVQTMSFFGLMLLLMGIVLLVMHLPDDYDYRRDVVYGSALAITALVVRKVLIRYLDISYKQVSYQLIVSYCGICFHIAFLYVVLLGAAFYW